MDNIEIENIETTESLLEVDEVQPAEQESEAVAEVLMEEPQCAVPELKVKKSCYGWKAVISFVIVLGLVAGASFGTAAYLNASWEKQLQEQSDAQKSAIEELQNQLMTLPAPEQNQEPGWEQADLTVVLPDGVVVDGELTPAQVYAMNVDAVVAISNQGLTTNIFGQVSQTASSGSGFIISDDGYVITNYHVIEGANTLQVITSDGVEHDAKVVGYDASNDISVLKIEGDDFTYTHIGSSDELVVGGQVVAIGNPLGELTSTLTVGYISAKNRQVNTDGTSMNMLQTDAAINSGNSGGPLFNMRGEVIGITTAKYSGTSTSGASIEGIGFAIPMDDVMDLVEDLIQFGYVKTGYMGVSVQDVPADDAKKYGLPMGALILDVVPGYCAQRAGLQAGDIIVSVDGYEISSVADLTHALRQYEPNMTAEVTAYRSGLKQTFHVVFDAKPAS